MNRVVSLMLTGGGGVGRGRRTAKVVRWEQLQEQWVAFECSAIT